MKKLFKMGTIWIFVLGMLLLSCCAPLSAEETEQERAYYEKKYANEAKPGARVQSLLDLLDTCAGGIYIYGAQGEAITQKFVDARRNAAPDYFIEGRLEYFLDIARKCEQEQEWDFPVDHAWDCSGLWWYAANELSLYDGEVDRTAHDTYHDYCAPIEKEELRPGDLVFYENPEGRITHMGIVGRHGYIYEAVSGFVGVVKKRTVDKRVYNDVVRGGVIPLDSWNVFGRPYIFE